MESINPPYIIAPHDPILVTGAAGFIGSRVLERLIALGFRNLKCFVRPSSRVERIDEIKRQSAPGVQMEIIRGNLLVQEDCNAGCREAAVILHLAAGTGEKSFPDAFMNSVVTTRNLLEASIRFGRLQRFVLVSSFAVYSNRQKSNLLDESSPIEDHPEERDAYCFAKVRQEEIIQEYAAKFGVRYVVVRPGSVYGVGRREITGRVGLGTFGVFLHLGGGNRIPFTNVENCAQAIALAGVVPGVEGEAFNVLDDDLPSSRQFLRAYKREVRSFRSIYVPHRLSYALCLLWEKYSRWSHGQLPLAFSRGHWYSLWRKTRYNNQKIKKMLGWKPLIPTQEALQSYFAAIKRDERAA